jgi:Tol biopolymer transport system component/DNA-binding winged helix-turn-helix (wHTH) protein
MASEGRIVRFGVFELDLDGGVLRKSGVRIKLQDQPFQILSILLERPGEIVSREELRTRLWPEGTFVDFDHSLNASINKLREALGDAASNARFIETVPRRGYRFIAPAQRPQVAQVLEAAPAPAPNPLPKRSSRHKMIAATATVALIAVAGLNTWRLFTTPQESAPKVVPLTSTPGVEFQPSFSPDGNYVVYTGGPWGIRALDVYVKQIGSEAVRRLTTDPAPDVSPKWSPDGRHIAFARVLGQREPFQAAVLITPVLGGAEHKVADIWLPTRPETSRVLLDWYPDSENMAVVDAGATGERCQLFGLNIRTGERWPLTTALAAGAGDLDPAVSPDGRHLVFVRHTSHENADIYLLRLTADLHPAGEAQALVLGMGGREPRWTPDGREILFAFGAYHRKKLSRMRVAPGSAPVPVPFAVEGTFALSAAVSRQWQLVYVTSRHDVDLYRTELGSNGNGIRTTRFLSSTFVEHLPEYSPDGKRIAFVSNRSGSQQIWLSDSDGSNAYQLTRLSGTLEATWPRWSPDGRRLVFTVGRSVYLVSVDGGAPAIYLKDVASREATADWSHDGRWIYVVSNGSGRDELWRFSAKAGQDNNQSTQLTRNGGGVPRASRDGSFIYYAKGTSPAELWRVPVQGGEEEQVVDTLSANGNFAVIRDGIYFISTPDETGRSALFFMDTRTLSRQRVSWFDEVPMWGVSVSPDRRYILHSASLGGESDLMLVENFR